MSSLVDLTANNKNNHVDIAQALSTTLIRPLLVSTSRTNWTIAYLPGPLPLSSLSTTPVDTLSNDRYYPFWILILIAVFGSITSVLTVLGNILVILAFFLDRQIRQPTNYFILSLSVSDFLIGLLSMPLLTIYIYAKEWPLNGTICDIWLSLDYTVCLTSIYTVLFITIDRFCSVKMPAKYRKWRTIRKINMMIAITWAVPFLIFFTATMLYPRLKGMSNLQSGVCDVQWNKNHVFNLCLTIGYFWTTLFVMITLYIFIYGVASNLEKKSQENARKMSSLVGMAGSAMTQIGVGIGVNKSPLKIPLDKENLTKKLPNDLEKAHQRGELNKQLSSNSSEPRHTNDGVDDENSNSFESHSDNDLNNKSEKKFSNNSHTNRRGMSVNWGSNSTTAINLTSTRQQKNTKSFAHSFYRNPIRLHALSSMKLKQPSASTHPSVSLTPIPSESELASCRMYPPPQPRPESLAIMSEELFHERLRARQSPLIANTDSIQPSIVITINNPLSASTSMEKTPTEDVHRSEETITQEKEDLIEIDPTPQLQQLMIQPMVNDVEDSWQLLNSNHNSDIPFIDESDFEDLGYILHRRSVPPADSNEPIHEETIVYKSPLFIKHKYQSKSSLSSPNHHHHTQIHPIHEIYGNEQDAQKVILESSIFDSVELITYACTNSNPSLDGIPIRHCSLRHVPREILVKPDKPSVSFPISSNDIHTTSSIIFISKSKTPLAQTITPLSLSPSPKRHADVERALIDFYQCTPIDDLTNSESEIFSNYKEINQETSSLLHLNERFSSAFIDDEYQDQSTNKNLMKLMVLNKNNLDTTSDERTLTNSISLNTYSEDFSVDKIFQQYNYDEDFPRHSWSSSSSSSSTTSSEDRQIPQHLLAAIEKKRNTSSDSDAVTTTTTTLTTSTIFGGSERRKISEDYKKSEHYPILKKHHSDTFLHETDLLSLNNRLVSKVTFESFVTQNSSMSLPKTKDQSVMAQIDIKDQPKIIPEQKENGRISTPNDGTGSATTGSNSAKSSIRELLQSQKSNSQRKSKSQNRARKALRTITFILGAFVVCWTPWHIYSAIHSLCESCKTNWIFSNPMFHCFYYLCYLNSPINPFCYALANQQFKKTFTRILKLDLRRL